MEWLTCIKTSIEYIENHIKENINLDDIATNSCVSSYYLQVGFNIMTGYSIGEYIRNRKLYLAALELNKGAKIIDVALDFSYETPESFAKAFKRFHGFNPSQIKNHKAKRFEPLTINIEIRGGAVDMNYKVTNMFPIKFIGFVKEFDAETSYKEIPLFWDEICEKYCFPHIYKGLPAENEYEQAIMDNCIGEYGVCIECKGNKFKYLIAGKYAGGKVPEGMMVYEFPAGKWAIFDCIGPCPEKLQELNTKIFKEWLPLNKEFELRGDGNIEWYDCVNGEKSDSNYHTQIWIPIKSIKK